MISFNTLKEGFEIDRPGTLRGWLKAVIKSENREPGDIDYILCSDEYLLDINRKYLDHHFLTDIITFPKTENKKVISAEIYISIDRVKENAKNEKVSFEKEFSRVLLHGILHLLGYNDHSQEEKIQMRSKEDYYLNLQP